MRVVLALLIAAGLATAAHAADPAPTAPRRPSLPMAGIITKPDWLAKPSAEAMSRAYPPLAGSLQIPGYVIIECQVSAEGRMENCKVDQQTPAGLGFGKAALMISSTFRMKPETLDGAPVAGGRVRVPITFKIEPGPAPGPPTPPAAIPAPEPSAEAKALGRRMAVALGNVEPLNIEQAEATLGPAPTDPAERRGRAALLKAASEASQALVPELRERVGDMYARIFSVAELGPIVAFMEGPAGKVWIARQKAVASSNRQIVQWVGQALGRGTRDRFCASVSCDIPDPDQLPVAAAVQAPTAADVLVTGQGARP